jgi:3-hydroxyacyl-[acyl-carrier-protein] dehydratase
MVDDTLAFARALAKLPHGPEFCFLNRLLSLDPGRSGMGEYQVSGEEHFLRGHFPGQPLFPGVLLIEAAAQLAGVVAQSDPKIPPLADLKLAALRSAKITGSAGPGETIRIEAQVTGRLANLVQAVAAAWVNDQLVLRTELTLSGEEPRAISR